MEAALNGKTAIVTGAGSEPGGSIATELAGAGAQVVVNDLNPDRAQKIVDQIERAGGRAVAIVADVANKFQCVHLIETARATYGQLDILVNGAGIAPAASVLKMDEWAWERCLNVNLKGVFLMSQLCGRVMADENGARGGVIVNLSAGHSEGDVLIDRAAFWASQAGIVGFGGACRREFAALSIRVHTVVTVVDTDSGAALVHRTPVQKIAAVVCGLCSPMIAGRDEEIFVLDG
jgi:NAD(P)-dependent dehydrogenase (short-subunit alcohol dehydrogenase family)